MKVLSVLLLVVLVAAPFASAVRCINLTPYEPIINGKISLLFPSFFYLLLMISIISIIFFLLPQV